MSSPKEKAEELIGKCYDTFVNDEDEHYTGTAWRLSKQCALIAVDELWNESDYTDGYYQRSIYWDEVKKQIERL
jgi:hypothetical protein